MDNDKNHKAGEGKPKLRWSYELHHRFIDAVNQLGGPNKATPKGLMRTLEIPELTLYHLKSHLQREYIFTLQKYRLEISEKFIGNKQDVSSAVKSQERQSQKYFGDQRDIFVTEEKDDHPNKNLQTKEAIETQFEVQKKLHEQIESKLQFRIEAQGKYLKSVLMKAQETLSRYKSSNIYGVASTAYRSCLSSSFSGLTQADECDFLGIKKPENIGIEPTGNSVDSSLASSSESSEAEQDLHSQTVMRRSNKLQFMEIKQASVYGDQTRGSDGADEKKVDRCPLHGTIYPEESLWRPRR